MSNFGISTTKKICRTHVQQECPKRARKFIAYIEKHRHRLVNYELLQAEHHISIGSGAVESAIKQIDLSLKILGAQWNPHSPEFDVKK